ncbi:ATP-binding protein [Jatrophihabitans sp. YIM 134969]
MTWSWTSSIPPSPEAPSVARQFIESSLSRAYRDVAAVADTCDDLTVIVSELVTNSVQAATTDLQVDLEIDDVWVRLAVTDAATGMPSVTGPAASTQPYGRGLAIVAALASDWGVVPLAAPRDGKTVWARLGLATPPDA